MDKPVEPDLLSRPLPRTRSRTAELVELLRGEILSGKLAPGAQLPTEQTLVSRLGVSRTVVREAVSALRADGLVATRQGLGAFVRMDAGQRPFRIEPEALETLEQLLSLMQLRACVEIEAAGLAAARRSRTALRKLRGYLARIDAELSHGEAAIQADFGFHRAIAEATGNPFFHDFMEYLGKLVIPRQSTNVIAQTDQARVAYLRAVQAEHRRIFAAIEAGEGAEAQEAMREHLRGSQERYRRVGRLRE